MLLERGHVAQSDSERPSAAGEFRKFAARCRIVLHFHMLKSSLCEIGSKDIGSRVLTQEYFIECITRSHEVVFYFFSEN